MTALSAAVLAGGRSSRMGQDKATMRFRGRPMVSAVADRLRTCSDDVYMVAKTGLGVDGERIVTDRPDADSPLAGVATALRVARHSLVFVCACDMPFVDARVVRMLAERLGPHDVAVPITDRPEPLHAVWRSAVAPVLERALADGRWALRRVLEDLDVAEVRDWNILDPEGRSFLNLNTPTDFERLA